MANYKIHDVTGAGGGEAYLIVTDSGSILFDSGYAFAAGAMISNIRRVLGERPLDAVFLTHSHYDHASGSAYCRAQWPELRVYAHPRAVKAFSSASALETIRRLNGVAARAEGVLSFEDKLELLRVDVPVTDGDVIEEAGLSFRVLETPSHTRDSLCFFCEAESLLLTCETLGVPMRDVGAPAAMTVMPTCLVGYQMALDAIDKCEACGAENILFTHYGPVTGGFCREFFPLSRARHEEMKNSQLDCWRRGGGVSDMMELRRQERLRLSFCKDRYPMDAYMLNAGITAKMLLREFLSLSEDEIAARP